MEQNKKFNKNQNNYRIKIYYIKQRTGHGVKIIVTLTILSKNSFTRNSRPE